MIVGSLMAVSMHLALTPLNMGEPALTPVAFDLKLDLPENIVNTAKRDVIDDTVTFFIPDIVANALTQEFAMGPVKQLSIRSMRDGTVFSITLVDPNLAEQVQLVAQPSPHIHVGAKIVPLSPEPLRKTEPAPRPTHPVGSLMIAASVLALFSIPALWWLRQKRRLTPESAAIDIIATRTLGPKHRLAMIEAGGERLLIAASDSGVQVLSRVNETTSFSHKLQAEQRNFDAGAAHPSDISGLLRLREAQEEKVNN